MRRFLPLLVCAVLPVALFVAATPAQAAYACSTVKFTGSVAQMKFFLNCKNVPFDVINTTTAAAEGVPAGATASYNMTGAAMTPASGGPSCTYLGEAPQPPGTFVPGPVRSMVKACYGGGTLHLICSKWFAGTTYPYHCGPIAAETIVQAQGAANWAGNNFPWHAAVACGIGAIPNMISAAIVVSTGGPIGIVAGAVGGCIGGILLYEFHP